MQCGKKDIPSSIPSYKIQRYKNSGDQCFYAVRLCCSEIWWNDTDTEKQKDSGGGGDPVLVPLRAL